MSAVSRVDRLLVDSQMLYWGGRPMPPPGATVVDIESDECCTCEPLVGRKWDAGLAKPAYVQLSDAAWQDFNNEMLRKVSSYRREGVGPLVFGTCMFLGIVLFHPAFGPVAMAMEDNQVGGAFMMPIAMLCVIGWVWTQVTLRQYNRKVDEEIQALLSRTSAQSGATFQLCTAWTQTCKPKHARTYRGVYISPAAPSQPMVVTGVPQYGTPQPVVTGTPQPEPQAPQTMLVTVPAGTSPGETVCITTPAGVQMQVVVPSGVAEGEQFQVALPAAPVVVAATVVAQPQ